jgi:hypothetical protein
VLDVPELSGTPGAVNSRAVTNTGPTYSGFAHTPTVPAISEPVTVSVTAHDPDGVAGLTLKYAVNGGATQSVAMTHQGSGRYTGQIPGQAANAVVQFYVEGTDSLGAASSFPALGAASRALIKVQDNLAPAGPKHNLRIIMTAADSSFLLDQANLMSSELLRATVLYDEREVFYDVGVRLKGSMPARQSSAFVGYALRFDPQHKFRGVYDSVSIDRSGRGALVANGQEEILIKQMMQAAGGVPQMYDDLVHVIAPGVTPGSALLILAEYSNDYLDSQYESGSDGTLFNFDLIYQQTATTNGQVEGPKTPVGYGHPGYNVDLEDLGTNPETYRWHHRIENNRARDDYSRLIEFLQAMSLPAGGYNSPLDLASRDLVDLDQWMRKFAAESLAGVGADYYGRGLNHNLKLYVRPEDNRVLAFPWDMDNSSFGLATTADLFPLANVRKLVDIPANKRLFYLHLLDLMQSTFNSTYLAQWTTHYGALAGQNFSGALTYLNDRNTHVTNNLPATVPFNLTVGDTVTSYTLVGSGAAARAIVPSVANGGDQFGTDWAEPLFVDSTWASGTTGVGYERASGYAGLIGLNVDSLIDQDNDDINENNTVYVRIPFTVNDPSLFENLTLRMKYDDGFVAYLNGVKLVDRNAPSSPTWNSEATTANSDAAAVVFQDFDVSAFLPLLVAGDNVLAIHGLNRQSNSSDMLILPELIAEDVDMGGSLHVNTPTATITGSGWIDVYEVRIDGRAEPLQLEWPDQDSWQVEVPLQFGEQSLVFRAFNYRGQQVGSDSITVTTTAGQPLQDALRVTELQYHPADPTPAELAIDPTFTQDDFEFLEIRNVGPGTIDLAGLQFTTGITFDFTGGAVTSLGPGEYAVVVESPTGFAARYPQAVSRVVGEYSGQLSNGGETITLLDALGQLVQSFTYDDNGPTWHPSTDGSGPSLVILNENAATSTWNDGASWRPSLFSQGSPGADDVLPTAQVVGRRVFYNSSAWDGNSTLANPADDGAIATDKSALLPGGTATLANYTSFSKGITGVMIDVVDLQGTPTLADFAFRVGNNNNVGSWTAPAAAATLSIRPGAGSGGSDRLTLTWPDGSITKRWLQVTMLETAATGLIAPDVFYFGNAVGESGDTTTNAAVNATDEIGARANPRSALVNPAPIDFRWDYNRDKAVNSTDQLIARTNTTTLANRLTLIAPPAAGGGGGANAQLLIAAADLLAPDLAASSSTWTGHGKRRPR